MLFHVGLKHNISALALSWQSLVTCACLNAINTAEQYNISAQSKDYSSALPRRNHQEGRYNFATG